jgi:hypothetical protein
VSLYAENSCFLLKPQLESLHWLIEDLDTFAILSGLKPNYDVYYITSVLWTYSVYKSQKKEMISLQYIFIER